jgi:AraC-like DNA-binding protein
MREAARSGFTASVTLLAPMVRELEEQGVDWRALARPIGFDDDTLARPEARIPIEWVFELGFAAEATLDDPAFGLHLAERYRPRSFGVLDYLAHNSRTLGDAIDALCRFNALLQDAIVTRADRARDTVLIWNAVPEALVVPPGVIENSIANLIVIGRELTGRFLIPVSAQFRHAAPPYAAEHRRIFRAPVTFSAERDGLTLPLAALDTPILEPDLWLSAVLERHAEELLRSARRRETLRDRVRRHLGEELRRGVPSAAHVARALGMSERTLRRRLEESSTGWAQLLDEFRRELAEHYLADPGVGLEELAHMLGYAEGGAFRRAFRRWHGISPTAWRQQLTAGRRRV